MGRFQDVTLRYYDQLPKLPQGWTWYIWEDVVDGQEKVFIRLRTPEGHDGGHGSLALSDDDPVIRMAKSILSINRRINPR